MARIVVIGAGLGAMAAAARLAVAGHRVTVYERGGTHGGAVGRFERDGFAFDTGPGLLQLPAVYRDLFVKTGRESLEDSVDLAPVDPAARHLFADGTDVTLPNASRGAVAALGAALGADAAERWDAFMGRAGDAWDRVRRPLLEEPLWPNWQVLGKDPYPSVPTRRLLRERRATTLAEVGARELRDPRLTALLESYALGFGLDPRRAPASAAVLPYMEQTFGTWYVRGGGMRALADAVYARCLARRVEFVFGAEVVEVTARDGRVGGVELADGTEVEADHVVAAVHPETLHALVHRRPDGPWEGHELYDEGDFVPERGVSGAGRVTVCLALSGARDPQAAHRTVVHSAHRPAELRTVFEEAGAPQSPTVWVMRPDDPALRPDDAHETVVLTAAAPSRDRADWRDPARGEAWADAMVAQASRAVEGLADRVRWREVRTPEDIAAETGAPAGDLPAPALAGASGGYLRRSNSPRLPGLYAAGGWAHPGGGLAHAGMSGALVAGLIVEGDGFRGSQ
ncbi:phytoene desaturase family protein [Streptomyces sp. NPDC087440]|uniref:phytoene desaturase family protein n=1 Tax=Streptomyces sp. NPDC087440 TaxID=3365790 RepID=UPI0037FF0FFB